MGLIQIILHTKYNAITTKLCCKITGLFKVLEITKIWSHCSPQSEQHEKLSLHITWNCISTKSCITYNRCYLPANKLGWSKHLPWSVKVDKTIPLLSRSFQIVFCSIGWINRVFWLVLNFMIVAICLAFMPTQRDIIWRSCKIHGSLC